MRDRPSATPVSSLVSSSILATGVALGDTFTFVVGRVANVAKVALGAGAGSLPSGDVVHMASQDAAAMDNAGGITPVDVTATAPASSLLALLRHHPLPRTEQVMRQVLSPAAAAFLVPVGTDGRQPQPPVSPQLPVPCTSAAVATALYVEAMAANAATTSARLVAPSVVPPLRGQPASHAVVNDHADGATAGESKGRDVEGGGTSLARTGPLQTALQLAYDAGVRGVSTPFVVAPTRDTFRRLRELLHRCLDVACELAQDLRLADSQGKVDVSATQHALAVVQVVLRSLLQVCTANMLALQRLPRVLWQAATAHAPQSQPPPTAGGVDKASDTVSNSGSSKRSEDTSPATVPVAWWRDTDKAVRQCVQDDLAALHGLLVRLCSAANTWVGARSSSDHAGSRSEHEHDAALCCGAIAEALVVRNYKGWCGVRMWSFSRRVVAWRRTMPQQCCALASKCSIPQLMCDTRCSKGWCKPCATRVAMILCHGHWLWHYSTVSGRCVLWLQRYRCLWACGHSHTLCVVVTLVIVRCGCHTGWSACHGGSLRVSGPTRRHGRRDSSCITHATRLVACPSTGKGYRGNSEGPRTAGP